MWATMYEHELKLAQNYPPSISQYRMNVFGWSLLLALRGRTQTINYYYFHDESDEFAVISYTVNKCGDNFVSYAHALRPVVIVVVGTECTYKQYLSMANTNTVYIITTAEEIRILKYRERMHGIYASHSYGGRPLWRSEWAYDEVGTKRAARI